MQYLVVSDGFAQDATTDECALICIDEVNDAVEGCPDTRLETEGDDGDDPLAYVMYTSGSSGQPKGVMISQASICNFLNVAPAAYDIQPSDRVYQGMSIAFDFSIEEIWVTWARGGTVVAGPAASRGLGAELADFLEAAAVTVLYCVPTVLATLPRQLPNIRTILVGGEACPSELVHRWAHSGRRMLNTYGPTETTVTATVAELHPDHPVTIGRPLPTYSVTLLDPNLDPVTAGEIGEICIGGPGVARGYLRRPEQTAAQFVTDPVTGERVYRTGDLGRLDCAGEIEFHGRLDAEVKVRGHRIDLNEIESRLLEDRAVHGAAVTAINDGSELAAYVVADQSDSSLRHRLHEHLCNRLPVHMVPSYIELVDALPALTSGKTDRKLLPPPSGPRLTASVLMQSPIDVEEARIRDIWARVLEMPVDAISVTANFFTELGGHSLLAVRAVAELRSVDRAPHVAVSDLQRYPTVRTLAEHLRRPPATPDNQTTASPGPVTAGVDVFVATCDLAAVVRGRGVPAEAHDAVLRSGTGWVPANLGIGAFQDIAADSPFGSTGDLRLVPDPATGVEIPGRDDRPALRIYLADQTLPDGTPWDCCPRQFLKQALDDLHAALGWRVKASFEHEFVLHGLPDSAPFSLRRHRDAEPFGTDLVRTLVHCGFEPENWLPEYGQGQFEITLAPTDALRAADRAILLREIVRDLAAHRGLSASFAPLHRLGATGSGVHVHFSLLDSHGHPVLYDPQRPGQLSAMGSRFAAGVLHHAAALTAWTAPSPVSFLRLVPNHWSAGGVFLGDRNREALLRICSAGQPGADPTAQFNLEYRAADATANPWLTLGVLVRAGLAGLTGGEAYPEPFVHNGSPDPGTTTALPGTLNDALDALSNDPVVTSWFSPELLACHLAVRNHEQATVAGLDDASKIKRIAEIY